MCWPSHRPVLRASKNQFPLKLEEVTSPVSFILFQDKDGDTPLHCAIAGENHNMEDMLLNNPRLMRTITNHKGFNYLQFAVLKGNKP